MNRTNMCPTAIAVFSMAIVGCMGVGAIAAYSLLRALGRWPQLH